MHAHADRYRSSDTGPRRRSRAGSFSVLEADDRPDMGSRIAHFRRGVVVTEALAGPGMGHGGAGTALLRHSRAYAAVEPTTHRSGAGPCASPRRRVPAGHHRDACARQAATKVRTFRSILTTERT